MLQARRLSHVACAALGLNLLTVAPSRNRLKIPQRTESSSAKLIYICSVIAAILLSTLLVASPATANSTTQCTDDSSHSFQVCIKQNYLTADKSTSGPYVDVLNYQVTFKRLDPSQLVQLKNAKVLTSVFGVCGFQCHGDSGMAAHKTYTIGSPLMNHTYTYTPSWTGMYILTSDHSWQGASVFATVTRYSSSWDMKLKVGQGSVGSIGYPG